MNSSDPKFLGLPPSRIKKFPSEDILQQAIAGLLTRMPDTSGVQILQGSQEFGKDLIFYHRGGFDEQTLCACVVKNTKITGDAGKNVGARTVFNQAQQAFDTPYTDESGTDVFVGKVYVVTPYDLAPPTIASIKGLLLQRSGQVVFICGAGLFDRFKKYWPDFLADEADALAQHLKHTSARYEEDNPLSTLISQYHLGSVDPNYKKIYVPQVFHRDLRSYSLGPVLTESVPSEEHLRREWNLAEVRKVRGDLDDLDAGLKFLYEWGYLDRTVLTAIGGAVTAFGSSIEREWRNSFEEIIRDEQMTEKERGEALEIQNLLLNDVRKLIDQRNLVYRQLAACLAPLSNVLQVLHTVVDPVRSRPITKLSYQDFHSICALNEFASGAPLGLLEVHGQRTVRLPKNIHDSWEGSLMIVGAPGFGKTSFCRWHALQNVESFASGSSNVLPVYIPLHRLGSGPLESFEKTFLATLGESALIVKDGRASDKNTRIRLYLDGLDEIPSETRRKELISLARAGVERSNKYQIILTARDHVQGMWLNWMPRISLSGFDDPEIIDLVSRWFEKNKPDAESFYNQLRVTPTLASLMHTPLLATLIILVFRQTGRLPESKTKLYEMFIDLLFGGWDMAKGILRESKFQRRIKTMALTTLAADLHTRGQREFTDSELEVSVREVFSNKALPNARELHNELVEDGLISRGGRVSQFAHLSFQEFLTAKSFMSDQQPKRVRHALEAFLDGNNWWREVLRFYIGLSTKPRDITLWLLSEIDRIGNKTDRTIPRKIINDLFSGVAEAFPEFPVEDLVNYRNDRAPASETRFLRRTARQSSKTQ